MVSINSGIVVEWEKREGNGGTGRSHMNKIRGIIILCALFWAGGCAGKAESPESGRAADRPETEWQETECQEAEESDSEAGGTSGADVQGEARDAKIVEADWSDAFQGINGAGVIYDPAENRYLIYNEELAMTRRSPCSTFKIVSAAIALENGILDPDHSTRPWSGEVFWNAEWNQDIDFEAAFRSSCVWYFREVVDEIGKELMQSGLDGLSYGNCDISDWEGRLNTNNDNPALTGFWIESSLKISPREQTEVMERIFGSHSEYSGKTKEQLERVMAAPVQEENGCSVYGKTGMGKAAGVVVDSWFTGFADGDGKRVYFCVYLGETQGAEVSSAKAREIAVRIVTDFFG